LIKDARQLAIRIPVYEIRGKTNDVNDVIKAVKKRVETASYQFKSEYIHKALNNMTAVEYSML